MHYKNLLVASVTVISLAYMLNGCKQTNKPAKETISAPADTTQVEVAEVDSSAPAAPADNILKATPAKNMKQQLTLTIDNLASGTAEVRVGAYGPKNKFPDPNDQLKEYRFKPKGKKLTATISDLPYGVYALAIYQDVNGDGKIDKNLIGIPTEGYAFSNNFKPTIKAPSFENCQFTYSARKHTVSMTMIQ